MEINDDGFKDLLGICLVDSTKIPYITTKVSIDDMPKGAWREIYKAINELYNLGVDVDIVTVSNRLLNTNKLKEVGGRKTINDLALQAPSSNFAKKVVDSVVSQTTYRKVVTVVDDFKKDVEGSDDVNATCIDYCGKISSIITGSANSDEVETISSGVDEVIADLYKSKKMVALV